MESTAQDSIGLKTTTDTKLYKFKQTSVIDSSMSETSSSNNEEGNYDGD